MEEEILFNSGLYDVLDQVNAALFKAGVISEKIYLENYDKIELARKNRKQEPKQEGTEL